MSALRVSRMPEGLSVPGKTRQLPARVRAPHIQQPDRDQGEPHGQQVHQLVQPLRALRGGLSHRSEYGSRMPRGASHHGGAGQNATLGTRLRSGRAAARQLRSLHAPAPRARAAEEHARIHAGVSAGRLTPGRRGHPVRSSARAPGAGGGAHAAVLWRPRRVGRARGSPGDLAGRAPGRRAEDGQPYRCRRLSDVCRHPRAARPGRDQRVAVRGTCGGSRRIVGRAGHVSGDAGGARSLYGSAPRADADGGARSAGRRGLAGRGAAALRRADRVLRVRRSHAVRRSRAGRRGRGAPGGALATAVRHVLCYVPRSLCRRRQAGDPCDRCSSGRRGRAGERRRARPGLRGAS